MEQIFQKNKVVTGKTPFFVIIHFEVAILFVSTLAFDRVVLNGKLEKNGKPSMVLMCFRS